MRSNLRRPLRKIIEKHVGGEVLRIELAQQVSFLNRVALTKALASVPQGGHVLLDVRDTDYIDADVLDLIHEYETEIAPVRKVRVSLVGFKDHYEQLEDRVQFADYSTRELQASLTPDQVMQILQDGNDRFRSGQPLVRDLARQREATATDRHPLAIGSVAPVRHARRNDLRYGPGRDSARVTGNLVSTGVLGSLEYACVLAGAKLMWCWDMPAPVMRMAVDTYLKQPTIPTGCTHLDPIIAEIQHAIDPPRWNGGNRNHPISSTRIWMNSIARISGVPSTPCNARVPPSATYCNPDRSSWSAACTMCTPAAWTSSDSMPRLAYATKLPTLPILRQKRGTSPFSRRGL